MSLCLSEREPNCAGEVNRLRIDDAPVVEQVAFFVSAVVKSPDVLAHDQSIVNTLLAVTSALLKPWVMVAAIYYYFYVMHFISHAFGLERKPMVVVQRHHVPAWVRTTARACR